MPLGSPVTRAYREQNLALRATAISDLQRLWPTLHYDDLARTFPSWFASTSNVVMRDRVKAAELAGQYLRTHRARSRVPGEPVIKLVSTIPSEQILVALQVTSIVAVKRSTAAGKNPQQAMTEAFIQSSGAATRLILNAGRDTIRASVAADPRIEGWQRVGVGRCEFCQMLLGRGAVYTEETADFEAHDGCACSAEPVYL